MSLLQGLPEGLCGSSILESMCPHPQLLVGPAQQGANLTHPQSGPSFPSCPSETKWLLRAGLPACKDVLPRVSPASVQHSGEEQLYWPQVCAEALSARGKPWGIAQRGQCCGTGRWDRWQHSNTSANRRRRFHHLQNFLLPGKLLFPMASQPQGVGLFSFCF